MEQFNVRKFLYENQSRFTNLSDAIWAVPELHFEEVESCRLTKLAMEEAGFDVTDNAGGLPTALMGSFGSGKSIIAFVGEYDALPNLSQEAGISQFSPITKGGNGHGCGHNLLGAGAFAAACAVKQYIEETDADATVRYYACPAEEKLGNRKFDHHVRPIAPEVLMYGSTDVSDISWIKPTVQFGGATWAIGTAFHSWQVVAQGKSSLAHKGMLFTAEVLAKTAIECIENPLIIEKVKEDLVNRLSGESYLSLIPTEK
ncbi:MAG: M20/M25/M40 family metallo-hydrolase [Kurthia sp.]|nr:M20/M25/M40 family metallo-hydrolase [Candidatus Kurthia equi]